MNTAVDRKHIYAILVGVAFSATFVVLSLWRIDLSQLWRTLRTSQWWPWYVLAPVIYMAGHFVRGMRCRRILAPHCDLDTWTASNVIIIGYGSNNLLPARMGEVVRAYVLSRKANISVSLSFAVTFLERLLDGLVITLILVVAGLFAPLPEWGRHLLWVAASIFLSASTAVVLVMVAKPFVLKLAARLTALLPPHLGGRILSILDRAIAATDCLRDTGLAPQILLLSLLVWAVEGCMFLVILPAFGLPMNPLWAWMALAVTNLGILFPSTPGYIGPFHYFCMQAMLIFGVSPEQALGVAIMAHLLHYVPVTIWGVAALGAYGVDIGAAMRNARVATPLPTSAEGLEVAP